MFTKNSKKILMCFCIILFLGMTISPVISAEANNALNATAIDSTKEKIDSFTVTEYEVITDLKQSSDSELMKRGYSTNEIAEIKDFSFEKSLLERAQLSEKSLYGMGYNSDQIALLKSYDGGPLENNPQMVAVFGTLSGTIYKNYMYSNQASAIFTWQWSNTPLICGPLRDTVACYFTATKTGGGSHTVVALNNSSTYCDVEYYFGNSKMNTTRYNVAFPSPQKSAEVKFPMEKNINGADCWAKKGTMVIAIREDVVVYNMAIAYFTFGYGHSVLTTTPSVNVPFGGGLEFGIGVTREFYKTIRLNINGTSQIYNGLA